MNGKAIRANKKLVQLFGKDTKPHSTEVVKSHTNTLADVVGKKYDFLTGRKTG